MFPTPIAIFLAELMSLQSDILEVAARRFKFTSPGQMRKLIDFGVIQKIVFVGEIADRPQQARSHRFGLRLGTELSLPLDACGVLQIKLWTVSFHVFLDELQRGLRL